MKISKLNNWNGNTITCDCCGKDIRHHYSIKGVEGVYGLACAQSLVGTDEIKNVQIETLIREIEELENFKPLPFLSDSDKEVSAKAIESQIKEKLSKIEELR